MEMTAGHGVDVAIEAVGVPATFDICQAILAPGGRLANVWGSRRPCHPAPGEVVGSQYHDQHSPGRHDHHADVAENSFRLLFWTKSAKSWVTRCGPGKIRQAIVELFGEVDGQEDHSPGEQGSSGQRSEGVQGKSKA
jgi:NADPH:quinone reductase-like Zn-dependent oxidoreductase